MKNHSNIFIIIKKEFARFFGDSQLIFTAVIMPGLLIYLMYSIMGSGIKNMVDDEKHEKVTIKVENLPQSVAPVLSFLETNGVVMHEMAFCENDIKALENKGLNMVLVRFPELFDEQIASYTPQSGNLAPNVEIYYNSANNSSRNVFNMIQNALVNYEHSMVNKFDINRVDDDGQGYDTASQEQIMGSLWGRILPMFIIMMLFAGITSIAPSMIAGEKERGTIATLLVTPMKRSELAIGKVLSLSCFALFSGISSFIGLALSLPKMMDGVDNAFNYTINDYVMLFLVILACLLILSSIAGLLSALAKDVKNAGTMIMPLMIVGVLVGLLPMINSVSIENTSVFFIPLYNSVVIMTELFSHSAHIGWIPVMITLLSSVAYASVAIWGLTRMFNSEKVMFSK